MKNKLLLILFIVPVLAVNAAYGQKSKPYSETDAEVYDGRIQQVTGKVVFLHQGKESTPASGQYIVFRRDGCKDCIVATYTDSEGKYKLFLGIGKYRLIVEFKNCGYAPVEDCAGHNYLADKQSQYLVVERGPLYSGEFNIELISPR